MNDIYKLVCRPEDYRSTQPRFHKLSPGDTFVIRDEENIVRPGDHYQDYPARIIQVIYAPKKWWQFWKKKKQLGYIVEWR